jgi:hypothetical protein
MNQPAPANTGDSTPASDGAVVMGTATEDELERSFPTPVV